MKLDDFTPLQRAKMAHQAASRLQTLPNGCQLPSAKSTVFVPGKVPGLGKSVILRKVVWMLERGEMPSGRLRTSCRTRGCCAIEHLTDEKGAERVTGLHVVRERYHMTVVQRRKAYQLFHDDRMRLNDISRLLKFSVTGIQRAIIHEKELRAGEAR